MLSTVVARCFEKLRLQEFARVTGSNLHTAVNEAAMYEEHELCMMI
jgi:hypothetical protein